MTLEQLEMIKYLNQAFYLDKRINALLAEKESNISLATRCTANYGDNNSNPTKHNSTEKILIRIAEQEEEIDNKIDKLVNIRKKISNLISTVQDLDEQTILSYRYLSYMTMEQIAEAMHYSVRNVQYKHKKAVANISLICTP